MAKARLTDFTGAEIRKDKLVAYATRRGNRVRMTEAVVLETMSDKRAGRVIPRLKVQPTGRDSGFSARSTLVPQYVSAEHVVVIGDAPAQ